jgi:AcrR family transcriptional regulator
MPHMSTTDGRIAGVAANLFHEHGITATGVDALSRAAGVSKRTLYEKFENKDGLITAAFDSLDIPVFEHLTKPAERNASDPLGQLDQLFAVMEKEVRSPDFHGCPFMNATAELADADHPAHLVVRRHKRRFQRWIRDRAQSAGLREPDRVARQLMVVIDGAQARAMVERSSTPVRDARDIARALIDAARP